MREPLTFYDAPNPRLWVRLAPGWTPDPELRWLISGAAHTARGRFHVCSEAGDLSVDIRDVVETSPEAAIWLDGFLHGQTPDLWEFMGADPYLMAHSEEDDWRRHEEWNRRFLQTGWARSLAVLPKRDARLTGLGTPLPWCYVGDRYRVWSGDDWTPADPQPEGHDWSGRYWPGSDCEALDDHDEIDDEDLDIEYCRRCHQVGERGVAV